MTLADRLAKHSTPEPNTGCLIWFGSKNDDGYGVIWYDKDGHRVLQTHRAAYLVRHGLIPEGLWVLHRCDNRPCINVDHLYLGTVTQNVRDMFERGRPNKAHGERHGMAKITPLIVARIRERVATGASQRSVAEDFGLTQTHISRIARGMTWQKESVNG